MKLLKSRRLWLILVFAIMALAAILFSLKWLIAGTILSALGSIASLYAIMETFFKIRSIDQETQSIKTALDKKVETLNLKETTEQINKNIQIVSRIQDFIRIRNHEAAVVLMEQLLVFLQSLKCNPTTESEVVAEIQKHIKALNSDMRNLRLVFGDNIDVSGLNYTLLAKHFTDLEDFLIFVSQQNHFKNDK